MDAFAALAALRTLDLPEGRRKHLCTLVATTPTDADREQIVDTAEQEALRNRLAAEDALKAELDARRAWAARGPGRPAESRTEPPRAAPRPTVHPVVTTWTTPTKTAKPRAERRPLFRKKTAEEVQPVAEKPVATPEVEHGLNGYKGGCRCDDCRAAKKASRTAKGARRPNGTIPNHGELGRYTNHKCRCQKCRDAMAAHARKRRKEKGP